jgi:hypothetical protein
MAVKNSKSNIKAMYVRFNLDKPLHKKAYDSLMSQSEFSNSQAAINAIADFYENKNIADRIVAAVEKSLAGFVPKSSPTISQNAKSPPDDSPEIEISNIDFDFLGG